MINCLTKLWNFRSKSVINWLHETSWDLSPEVRVDFEAEDSCGWDSEEEWGATDEDEAIL